MAEVIDTYIMPVPELTEKESLRLVAVSAEDPAIAEFCPQDAERRFSSIGAVAKWAADESREILGMYTSEGLLTGIFWTRQLDIDGDFTLGLRLYEEARGKQTTDGQKQSVRFMRAGIGRFFESHPTQTRITLEVSSANTRAQSLYKALGFDVLNEDPGSDRLKMALSRTAYYDL